MTVFCTKDDVKKITPTSANFLGHDAVMDKLIPVATSQIRQFCRRKFDLAEYTEYFMSPDSLSTPEPRRIYVNEPPISLGTVFAYHDATGVYIVESSIAELIENTDFSVDYEQGVITLLGSFSYNRRGIKVIYTGGYTVAGDLLSVPDDIKMGCAMQTAFLLERNLAGQMGQVTAEDATRMSAKFTASATSGLISEVQNMVATYRRPLIGRG